jgi:hypothetical protein
MIANANVQQCDEDLAKFFDVIAAQETWTLHEDAPNPVFGMASDLFYYIKKSIDRFGASESIFGLHVVLCKHINRYGALLRRLLFAEPSRYQVEIIAGTARFCEAKSLNFEEALMAKLPPKLRTRVSMNLCVEEFALIYNHAQFMLNNPGMLP